MTEMMSTGTWLSNCMRVAPLRIAPFTPTFLGRGTIGQFSTFARPDPGFWLALGAAALLVLACTVVILIPVLSYGLLLGQHREVAGRTLRAAVVASAAYI